MPDPINDPLYDVFRLIRLSGFNILSMILRREGGMSRLNFFQTFKEVMGVSPTYYFNHLQMMRARDWLINSALNITEVADNTDYASVAAFLPCIQAAYFGKSKHLLRLITNSLCHDQRAEIRPDGTDHVGELYRLS